MKLYLTKGMFGEDKLSQIGTDFDKPNHAFELINDWKNDKNNQKEYKVECYDRLLFDPDNKQIAIDFGDYSTFMLITDVDDKKMKTFKGI